MTYILGLLNYWSVSFERECQNNHSYTQLSLYFLSYIGYLQCFYYCLYSLFLSIFLLLILAAIPISYYFSSYQHILSLFFPDQAPLVFLLLSTSFSYSYSHYTNVYHFLLPLAFSLCYFYSQYHCNTPCFIATLSYFLYIIIFRFSGSTLLPRLSVWTCAELSLVAHSFPFMYIRITRSLHLALQ